MRILLSSLFALSLFAFTSCSKQPIEDVTQAALENILVGTWKVASVKYTQEFGIASTTNTSFAASGNFTFTPDSTYHDVNYTYKITVEDVSVDVPGRVSQNGYYSLLESDDDKIEVIDRQSSSIVRYETRLRTASSMTLIYEFKDVEPTTGSKLVDRYTFSLVKI